MTGADVTTWAYGPGGLPQSLATGGHTFAFTHDALGRETERALGSGLTITSAWDVAGRLAEQAISATAESGAVGVTQEATVLGAPVNAGQQRLINRRRWTYRPDGNPVSIDDHLSGATSFDLDPLGRIAAATTTQGVETYTYDRNSNPLSASWPVSPSSADTDSAAALGERTLTRGRITGAGRTTYTHDAQGRVVSRRVRTLSGQTREWQYAWDAHDRLTTVATPDGVVWRYTYDALGRRVAKQRLTATGEVAAEVTFTWHGSQLVEQAASRPAQPDRGTSTTTWTYAPGTWRPLTQREGTTTTRAGQAPSAPSTARSRFHVIATDLVGTPLELLTPTGAITWTQHATSYGVPLDPADLRASLCPLRFPGQYYDPETGHNYNHHRTYDPATTTYTTPDPLGLTPGPNPVSYVPNPTTCTDPLGLAPYGPGGDGLSQPIWTGTVFRADSRVPSLIFSQGFEPKGSSLNLVRHVFENPLDSGFVSTSRDLTSAAVFAQENGYKYVYEAVSSGFDVNQIFGARSPFKRENEIAIPGAIAPVAIIRAWDGAKWILNRGGGW